ncbi:hypothetical protein PGB90_003711 [Kerria lacca]
MFSESGIQETLDSTSTKLNAIKLNENPTSKIVLDRNPLDEESKKVAENELRETPERVIESVNELRKILKVDKSLQYDDSEEFLIMMLRPVKFYPESAYGLMKRIADFRKANAEILKNVSPETDKDSFLNSKVVNVLVDRDQKRRRILVMNLGSNWNPKELNIDKLFRILYLIHFGALMEPLTQVHGSIIIMDFTDLSRTQAFAFTPAFSKRLLTFIQEVVPLRIKAVHIVFQPFVFKIVWNLFKPFIGAKLKSRIFFHGAKLASLHEHIDPNYLPEEYGGTRGKIDYSGADWYPVLAELENTIKDIQKVHN